MRYVFDFDRVLFDTDRFVSDLRSKHVYDKGTPRDAALLEAAKESGIDLSDYVDHDAVVFIKEHPGECAIVSSYQSRYDDNNEGGDEILAEFQREKIYQSGLGKLVKKVLVTNGDKSEALREVYSDGSIFVDDEPTNVETARSLGYRTVFFGVSKKLFANPEKPTQESIVDVMESGEIFKVTNFEQFIDLVKEWETEQ